MTSRELLDIVAEYIEARDAAERLIEFPGARPIHDIEAIAARWDAALGEYVESRHSRVDA
jgi:hypothetical protein